MPISLDNLRPPSDRRHVGVRTVPTWFGPTDGRLFGWMHLPEQGDARGMVVLCSPLGREEANAAPALQELAGTLAQRGVVVLRFDYSGTGDSTGRFDDPDRLTQWISDIGEALALSRQTTPGPVLLAGMRMGALLAQEAILRGADVDGFVAWDPLSSGRMFLRLEKTLLATGYGESQPDDGSVAGPAFLFSAQTAGDIGPLTFQPDGIPTLLPTLVLTRTGMSGVKGAVSERSNREWQVAKGQAELLEVPPDNITLPSDTIVAIAEWLAGVVGNDELPISVDPVESAVVAQGPDGRRVTEHPVSLGPHGLFGMATDPDEATKPGMPTVVLLSAGALPHTGPGRMWVELARDLAGFGLPSIRVDIDGVGESFGRSQLARQIPKPLEAIEDLEDIARALGDPDAHNLVFVGLSSGGYHAFEAGLRLNPLGVCAINPGLVGWVPEMELGYVDHRRLAARPVPRPLRSLSVRHDRIANWTWRALLQLWVTRSPSHAVAEVSRRRIPVLLVVSESDFDQFEPSLYWAHARRKLHRRGLLEIQVVAGSDHSLYTQRGKAIAYPLVIRWLTERFASQ